MSPQTVAHSHVGTRARSTEARRKHETFPPPLDGARASCRVSTEIEHLWSLAPWAQNSCRGRVSSNLTPRAQTTNLYMHYLKTVWYIRNQSGIPVKQTLPDAQCAVSLRLTRMKTPVEPCRKATGIRKVYGTSTCTPMCIVASIYQSHFFFENPKSLSSGGKPGEDSHLREQGEVGPPSRRQLTTILF